MDKYREEEIEKAKKAKRMFELNSWISFSNCELYTEAYKRLENYGLIELVRNNVGLEARLGHLGIKELELFIETGKTKEEREKESLIKIKEEETIKTLKTQKPLYKIYLFLKKKSEEIFTAVTIAILILIATKYFQLN